MALTAPAWLIEHGGDLRLGSDGQTWYVFFGADPDYALTVRPVSGKHGCVIRQTNNGRLVDCPGAFATPEEALAAGLEALRKDLGWGS